MSDDESVMAARRAMERVAQSLAGVPVTFRWKTGPQPARPSAPEPPPQIRMVGDRRMQCKDIPDDVFLDAVRAAKGRYSATRWNTQEQLERVVGPIPENLFLAKARKLIKAGKLDGCPCGCRGDYEVPDEPQVEITPRGFPLLQGCPPLPVWLTGGQR